jgi:uncharacterized protein (TIGR03000 family)
MSRLLLPAAVFFLTPALASAQLPFYFSEPPGNPALGYRTTGPMVTPPPVVYRPLTGPGVGPVFAPTYFDGWNSGIVHTYAAGLPLYAAGYYPTYGTPGYVPPLPLTVVIVEELAVPAAPEPAAVPVAAFPAAKPVPAAAPAAGTKASLTLKFPAKAKVWLDGRTAAGDDAAERTLTSPPLRAGEKYSFKVKAEWTDGGATRTYDRTVTVGAGESTRVIVLGGK